MKWHLLHVVRIAISLEVLYCVAALLPQHAVCCVCELTVLFIICQQSSQNRHIVIVIMNCFFNFKI